MPIDKGTPSNNTGITDIPMYYNWPPLIEVHRYKSTNIPGEIPFEAIPILIKDVIGIYPQYSTFRLRYTKSYLPATGITWLQGFTYTDSGIPDLTNVLPITENGMIIDFPLDIVNENLLNVGDYKLRQAFVIQGRSSVFAPWTDLSSCNHDTFLHIVNDLVFYDPKTLKFSHNIGTSLPTKQVVLQGVSWKLVGNPKFSLSSTDPSVVIQTMSSIDGDYQIANGTGTATVSITLTTYFDLPSSFFNSTDYLQVLQGSTFVGNVIVKVRRFMADILLLTPEAISFVSEKNVTEAAPQNLIFDCNVSYLIEASPWLTTLVDIASIDGIPTQVIVVSPISNYNMDAGIYTGFVKVTATIGGIVKVVTTVVNYEIIGLVQFPYSYDMLNFTLDNKFINLLTFNSGTYFQMNTIIKAFDFFTNTEREYSIFEKIGLFQGRAKVNIGKTVHQIMNTEKPLNENVLQYKPALVKLFFEERNHSDDEIVRTKNSDDFKFLAGLSTNFLKFGFLKLNHLPERVTSQSYKYLNIAVPEGAFELVTYRNGVVFSTQNLIPSEDKTMTIKVFFDEFTQGDFISFAVVNVNHEECSKVSYILFPDEMQSHTLNWEDEFLLKQAVECTGNYTVKSNLNFISQKKYVNLVEQLSHLETSKVAKVAINTGWLLNTDVDMIESLMRSKKVWITANDKTIFLIPVSDSMTNTDSQRELIDYTLEFQINPTYNEETYRL